MDLIRDVLDNQIVDRNQRNMGKVDGIVMELRDREPPRLAYIEVGMPTLARRLHPRLQRWVAALQSKWGAKHSRCRSRSNASARLRKMGSRAYHWKDSRSRVKTIPQCLLPTPPSGTGAPSPYFLLHNRGLGYYRYWCSHTNLMK